MDKLKKSSTTLLGLVLTMGLLSTPAFASYTRIVGMGLNNWNVTDGFNIWLNPAWTASYSNVVIAELGTQVAVFNAPGTYYNTPPAGQWGGLIHDHKGMGSFGMFIRRPYGVADANGNYGYGASGYFGPTSRADLIGNTTFATAGGAGLRGIVGTDIFLSGAAAYGPLDTTGAALLGGAVGGTAVGGYAVATNQAITAPAPTHRFDLFWAKKEFMKDWDLGFNVSWAGAQNSPTYTQAGVSSQATDGFVMTERTSNDWNFGVGTVYHMNNATIPWIEASVNLGMPSFSATRTESEQIAAGGTLKQSATGSVKSDGASAMNIFIRAQVNWETNQVGYLSFRMQSANVNGTTVLNADTDGDGATIDDYDRSGTFKDSASGWMLDHSKTFMFSDRLMAICSIGVSSMTFEQSATNNSNVTGATGVLQSDSMKTELFTVPVSIAAEHKTLDWLTTRFGVTKNVYAGNKDTSSDGDPTIPTAATNTTFSNSRSYYADTALVMNTGVSVMIANDMGVDAVLRQGILFGGPFFVSGVPNSMFGQLTAWYKF